MDFNRETYFRKRNTKNSNMISTSAIVHYMLDTRDWRSVTRNKDPTRYELPDRR